MDQMQKIVEFSASATEEIVDILSSPMQTPKYVTFTADTLLRIEVTNEEDGTKAAEISYGDQGDGAINPWFPKEDILQEIAKQLQEAEFHDWTHTIVLGNGSISLRMNRVIMDEETSLLVRMLKEIGKKCDLKVISTPMAEIRLPSRPEEAAVQGLSVQIFLAPGQPMIQYNTWVAAERIGNLMHYLGWRSISMWVRKQNKLENDFGRNNPNQSNWTQFVAPMGNTVVKPEAPTYPWHRQPGAMHTPGVFGMPPGGSPYFSADSFKDAGVGVPPNLTPQQLGELYRNHPLNPFVRHSVMPMEHTHGFAPCGDTAPYSDHEKIDALISWARGAYQLVGNRLKEIGADSGGWGWQISQEKAQNYVKSMGRDSFPYQEAEVSVENGSLIISAGAGGNRKLESHLEGLLLEIVAPHIRNLKNHGVAMKAEFVSDEGFVRLKVTRAETPDNKTSETEN